MNGHANEAEKLLLKAGAMADLVGAQLPDWYDTELASVYVAKADWLNAIRVAMRGSASKPALGLVAARASAKLGQIAEARQFYVHALRQLRSDHTRAEAFRAAAVDMLNADASEETWKCVNEAAGSFPNHLPFLTLAAERAASQGNWEVATALLRKAGGSSPLPGMLGAYRRVIEALRSVNAPFEAVDDIYRYVILQNSDDRSICNEWISYIGATGRKGDVVTLLSELQVNAKSIIPSVILCLTDPCSEAEIKERFAKQIDIFTEGDVLKQYTSAIANIATFTFLSKTNLVASVPHNTAHMVVRFNRGGMRSIKIMRPNRDDEEYLSSLGIQWQVLQGFFSDFLQLASSRELELDQAIYSSTVAKEHIHLLERYTAYQDRIVSSGVFELPDPWSGRSTKAFDSVVIHDRQVFSFRGKSLFIFMSGGAGGKALCIYIPTHNLVLDLEARLPRHIGPAYISNVMAVYYKRAEKAYSRYLEASAGAEDAGPRKVVLFHGKIENFAHHLFNFYPGFERINKADLAENVSRIVYSGTLYFGDPRLVFRCFYGKPLEKVENKVVIDPCPFSMKEMLVQPGGYFMSRYMLNRVAQLAGEIEIPAGKPLVWIGVRIGDKSWIGQQEGIIRIIARVVDTHPGARFLIDAFSLPSGIHQVPPAWAAAYQKLDMMVNSIISQSEHSDAITSLVGRSLSETVAYARHIDAYVSPLGTTQHKVGWFTEAPGIVYTSPGFVAGPVEKRVGAWEAEGSQVPLYIVGDVVDEGERRNFSDMRLHLQNVQLDPEIIADELLKLLLERGISANPRTYRRDT
ncbi:hypothetical protein FOZ76_02755 [Verticiella sediminum]|uniref:Tetratricopeptide repeat protein n=1 Tax=Verticiella sediminum TaxID=1247510 RepID=A0A556B0L1_9BURK|nr:hypothetical protein [Verticiella sediminum]TSH98684.1 hypothetical protein FOZ76_02755 [Verticiella sediminum]